MSICIFTRDLFRFEGQQSNIAAADAAIEHECELVRSICSIDEIASVAIGSEIAVIWSLVERLAIRRIQGAQDAAAAEIAADRYEAMREHCF